METEMSELLIQNMENILQSRENEDALFQRLSEMIAESRTKTATLLNKFVNKQKNLKNKIKINTETLNHLHHQSKDLEQKLQQCALEQKVLNKKISNNNKTIEQLREEVESQQSKKEKLTLELVDLEADHEKVKNEKIKEYSALKRAVGVFKEKLNIHIAVESLDDHDRIRVTYFLKKNPNKDYYYLQLLSYNNVVWKVESIVPELGEDHMKALKLDFYKDYEIQDIIKLIPKLRRLFINHYLSP